MVAEPAEVVVVRLVVGGEGLQLRLVGGDRLRHRQRVRQAGALHPAHQRRLVTAHQGVAVYEVGVVAGLGRGARLTREAGQAGHAPGALQVAGAAQLRLHRRHTGRTAGPVQTHHRRPHQFVRGLVPVTRSYGPRHVGHRVVRGRGHQAGTERTALRVHGDGLLLVQSLRGHLATSTSLLVMPGCVQRR
jgi:hypothetical protein